MLHNAALGYSQCGNLQCYENMVRRMYWTSRPLAEELQAASEVSFLARGQW